MDQKQIDNGRLLRVLTHPDPHLRRVAQLVDLERLNDKKFQELIVNMAKTMLVKDGIGLAATQIGRNWRLIVVNTDDGVWPMINPVLSQFSPETVIEEEGCLSVPGIFGPVERANQLICDYLDENGQQHCLSAQGTLARVLQHEIDHLDGRLFIDRLSS